MSARRELQVQGGVIEGLRTLLINPPADPSAAVAAKLRTVGAEMMQKVRHFPPAIEGSEYHLAVQPAPMHIRLLPSLC